jgi:hypothetical protein
MLLIYWLYIGDEGQAKEDETKKGEGSKVSVEAS